MDINYDLPLHFLGSYKNTLTYENDYYIVKCTDYKFEFEAVETLETLKHCDIVEVIIKEELDENGTAVKRIV